MKKLVISIFLSFLTFSSYCEPFHFVSNDDGKGLYLQIDEDIKDFKFDVDWHSIGNSAYITTSRIYDEENQTISSKKSGNYVSFGDVKSGDRYIFELHRKNGRVIDDWMFMTDEKYGNYIAFDKNNGSGKDEILIIKGYEQQTSGQPLPNFFHIFVIWTIVFVVFQKLKKDQIKLNS